VGKIIVWTLESVCGYSKGHSHENDIEIITLNDRLGRNDTPKLKNYRSLDVP
jgi:hypothetical protein